MLESRSWLQLLAEGQGMNYAQARFLSAGAERRDVDTPGVQTPGGTGAQLLAGDVLQPLG